MRGKGRKGRACWRKSEAEREERKREMSQSETGPDTEKWLKSWPNRRFDILYIVPASEEREIGTTLITRWYTESPRRNGDSSGRVKNAFDRKDFHEESRASAYAYCFVIFISKGIWNIFALQLISYKLKIFRILYRRSRLNHHKL